MADLEQLVLNEKLSADYLLLPGDIANRANAEGLQYGWRRSHTIAASLGAHLIATAGNHDVVTHSFTEDPQQMLRDLLPSFPTGDPEVDVAYWDRGWTVVEHDDHRFVVLNSTADFPPFPRDAGEEAGALYRLTVERGGLAANVEQELEAYLDSAPPKLNILLVHHHPVEHQLPTGLQDTYGPMRRGSELIDLLTSAHSTGRWLIVHGHKHVPQLAAATSTSANGPIVLCAGSLGAKLWDPVTTVARNQFHILEVTADLSGTGPGLLGKVESWTWGVGVGWYRSERRGSGLPGLTGFGNTTEPRVLLSRIDAAVPETPGMFVQHHELIRTVPELPYLMPADETMLEEMAKRRGLQFHRSSGGQLLTVAREVRDS
ncbi:MAG: hypothetical protein K0S37_1954 [Microbacterium sp.]|nr:hypothetical protein [Microbacterium sp.]